MEKALSPLMASIILIALTLTVAAFLGSWLTTMTKSQTGSVEKTGEKMINCKYINNSKYTDYSCDRQEIINFILLINQVNPKLETTFILF